MRVLAESGWMSSFSGELVDGGAVSRMDLIPCEQSVSARTRRARQFNVFPSSSCEYAIFRHLDRQ